jgi:gliding motility-associated-like protein
MKRLFYLLSIIFLLVSLTSKAQIDTEFWFAPPDLTRGTSTETPRDRPILLVLSTLGDGATVSVIKPSNLSFGPITVNIPPNSSSTINLTPFIEEIETRPADTVLNTGLLIRSTAPITAYYEVRSPNNTDIFSLKGKNANGDLFYVPLQNIWNNSQSLNGNPYIPAPRSGFVIIATDDTTNVTITPTKDLVGHPAGIPYTIQLMRGQTYYGEATSFLGSEHPTGTKIEADKPIAVTTKDDMVDLDQSSDSNADVAADQLIAIEWLGSQHIIIRGQLTGFGSNQDKVFLLAVEDNTEIFIGDDPVAVATINTGEQYQYDLETDAVFIRSSAPTYVWQVSGIGEQIAAAIIPSLECTGSNQVGFNRSSSNTFVMNLTIRNGSQNSFLLNGSSDLVPGSAFTEVPGTDGEWVWARFSYSNSQLPAGTTSLLQNFSDELFHMGILNRSKGQSANDVYFSNFSFLNLGNNPALCLGDSAVLDAGPGKTSYVWSTGDTTQKITVFEAGEYYVRTLSGTLCEAVDTISVSFYEPPVTIQTPRDTICEGTSVLLTVPGVYLFEWQDGSTNPFFIASEEGEYIVTVTDFQGCRARDTLNIYTSPRPQTPEASFVGAPIEMRSDTLCSGEASSLEMTALEGATYLWLGPNNTLYPGQNLNFNSVSTNQSGEFLAFFVVDGCESFYDTLSLLVNPSPEVYIGLTDTVCDSAEILLDAGSGATEYLWQDNSTGQTLLAQTNGLYWVEVKNEFECVTRDSVDLFFSIRPESPVLTIDGVNQDSITLCSGSSANLQVGTIQDGFYFWVTSTDTIQTPGGSFPLENIQLPSAGLYYAYYSQNGCASIADSVFIEVDLSPNVEIQSQFSGECEGDSVELLAISAEAEGFDWNNGLSEEALLEVNTSGTYIVRVRTASGCFSLDTLIVNLNPLPANPEITGDLTACEGETLTLQSNNQQGVEYSWNTPLGQTDSPTLTINEITLQSAGNYVLTATLNGCAAAESASVELTVFTLPELNLGNDVNGCVGSNVSLNGPDGFASYAWSNGANTQATSVGSGSYILTVTNAEGCEASDEISVILSGPVAQFTSNPETGTQTGTAIAFTDESTGGPATWNWIFGDGGQQAIQNPSHTYNQLGTFEVLLVVTDEFGCSDSTSRSFVISYEVKVPNSFTPNGDGFNDLFVIKGLEAFPNSSLTIFNRWGSEIFTTTAYNNDWSATGQPDGVYFCIIELSNGSKIKQDVTVIRSK